ncbi:DUF1749-domain-containing protein [Macroventuria anomochaeta]|uniref:DUF1749-domain-containing protein n=1 Tax=Macroventuria anomochaeta TaxID=301207 RepID=A0ACB6S4M8_9PLEO|nr:DUF1749-domain-containing protein [Macroventuria anomochaeta]KAF2628349.1 DUF1749-domain-containing protein [Macroventuria anomochaeta]
MRMAHAGTAHKYSERLIAFEHAGAHSKNTDQAANTLLWIGGLGDGLLTVQYPSTIATSLPPSWSISEVLLSSSYRGWATSSLQKDARELAQCVEYFQSARPGKKIVLMGHSTGCQDVMEYLLGRGHEERPKINGAILQGGLSDREAWDFLLESKEEKDSCAAVLVEAQRLIKEGKEREIVYREGNIVQKELGAAISAYRTNSLLAKGGDDDYFSTDLDDSTLRNSFGRIPSSVPIMFLLGSEDPFMHKNTDKPALLSRWAGFVKEGGGKVDESNGGVVEGGHHNLNGDPEEVVGDLVKRVVGFVEGLGQGGEGLESRL